MELLTLGEGEVILCPGLIVIQGDEQGHPSPCRVRATQQSRAWDRGSKGPAPPRVLFPNQALCLPMAAAPGSQRPLEPSGFLIWASQLGFPCIQGTCLPAHPYHPGELPSHPFPLFPTKTSHWGPVIRVPLSDGNRAMSSPQTGISEVGPYILPQTVL